MPISRSLLSALILCGLAAGCSTTTTSNTARTATEQLLISNAVDQALNKVDFETFAGQQVFIEDKYLDSVDKQYLVASLRHRLLYHGSNIATTADSSDVVLEVRSGGIGTDNTESFYGLPEIVLPGMVSLPELKLVTRNVQRGTAKIGLVALDPKTSEILGDGGVSMAVADNSDLNVLGLGPFKSGTLRHELKESTQRDHYDLRSDLPRRVAFSVPAEQFEGGSEENRIRLAGHSEPGDAE